MNWTEKNAIPEPRQDISDNLEGTGVSINYAPYKSACLFLSLSYEHCKQIDVNDRDGTRRMVLRELLPLAEAALVTLRQAVAENEPPMLTRHDGQTRPAVVEIPDVPSVTAATSTALVHDYGSGKTLDMVGFANNLLRGPK